VVDAAYRELRETRKFTKGGKGTAYFASDAFAAGKAAGDKVNLNRPVEGGTVAGALQ
jgi:hypothetical protein